MNLKSLKVFLLFLAIWILLGLCSFVNAEDKSKIKSWKWKLGIDDRFRYEYRSDFDYDESLKDNGSWIFNRLKINAAGKFTDEYQKEKAVVFVEGMDIPVGGYQIKPQVSQKDALDLHQAYFQIFDILGSDFDVKAGRMEVKYGSGRLIAQPSWSNRMRHFDGGIATYNHGGLNTDLLYLNDVKYDDNNYNKSLNSEFIYGLYASYQEDKVKPLVEFYFLPQVINSGTSDIHRYTIGGRFQSYLPGHVLGEVEFPFQFGKNAGKDIRANALNISLSKGWETGWKPKVYFEYNLASGDEDSSDGEVNTFIPLYQGTHDPYGLLDFFRWQNMQEAAWKLDVMPIDKWKFTPQFNFFWLENKNDSWVNSSGTAIRSKTSGERSNYVGSEVSLRAYYDLNKYTKIETGYAHFFSGDYVKDSGANDDTDWVYSQVTFKY